MRKMDNEQGKDNETSDRKRFSFRINLFFFSSFIIFTVIIVRLAILQFVDGPQLKQQEASNVTKNVPLTPIRGTIYDSTGQNRLAYSTPVQSLYITLSKNYSDSVEEKRNPDKKLLPELENMTQKLANRFAEYGDKNEPKMTAEQIMDAMDRNYQRLSGFTPRLIKTNLSKEEVAYFMQHKSEFPGIDVVEETVRHYDPDTVAVQTVGYIKSYKSARETLDKYKNIQKSMSAENDPGLIYMDNESVGFDGLEYQYQEQLRGKNGYKTVPIDPRNMPEGVDSVTPPQKGDNVYSTINKEIQVKTENAIMDQLRWLHTHAVSGRTHPYAKTGFAVAMEVDTGNVVAMASMPDYDANYWQTGTISKDKYEEIKHVYQNATIKNVGSGQSGQHPDSTVLLGSTIKPLSVLIGLEEGLFTTNTYYQDTGAAYFGRNNSARVRNSSGHVYGSMDPATAIRHSSNAFMVDMVGKRLYNKYRNNATEDQGINVWDRYMKEFGLGVSTGVDLPGEFRGWREYTNKSESVLSRLAYASFGQQGKYTPMQLAQYATMIATKGKRMEPHLVSQIKDTNGNVVQTIKPKVLNEVKFPDAYWNEVIRGMATDVSAFKGFPYDFARKTGTSQQSVGRELKDNGVFIAFAPRQNPKLAVAVVIPEGGFGAWSAGPVARKIFDAYDEVYGLDGVPKKKDAATADPNTAKQP
ncbi:MULTISPECIES: peptidoglycan D,D-transpeptidase FtsI family protein [Paenibacillus]|uniref:peptidoglycan D,D-transpeptidase FtsI family protein n=1 Tax=Paenibacillus TaxID=44249 RepID=UPI000303BA02|nr:MULTISPECIES: penicillin-binding transpeptidase domain-containing protein [Paenibacillus]KKD54159.1 cell division protein FtsI [Paenibacillus sp. ICGEB2008]UNL93810.1 cell division protein FtsI [Paenibacillus polymyxa]